MKKFYLKILLLLLIDIALIWIWFIKGPTPNGSSAITPIIPIVFGLNIFVAILYYFRDKESMKLFLINSILASTCLFVLGEGVDRYLNQNIDRWGFMLADTTYSITHWKNSGSTFGISYTVGKFSNVGFIQGEISKSDNEMILHTYPMFSTNSSGEYVIRNHYLFGFRSDSVKLEKVQW